MISKVRSTLTPDWDRIGLEKPRSIFRQASMPPLEESLTSFHPAQFEVEKPIQHFITGSSYEGFWDTLGFSGLGTYVFPHGAIYQGYFRDGEFHGKGLITYPMGDKLKGFWNHGRLMEYKFVFFDGLEMSDPWKYCYSADRRFQAELNTELKGPGEELLTNRQPTLPVPKGCFDTIDGYYVPEVNCIFNYDENSIDLHRNLRSTNLKRLVQPEEGAFIEANYRTCRLNHMGLRPDLYEYWTNGNAADVENIAVDMAVDEEPSDEMQGSEDNMQAII